MSYLFWNKKSNIVLCAILTSYFSCVSLCYAALTPLELSEEAAPRIEAAPGRTWIKGFNESRDNFAEKYGTRFGFVLNYTQQTILRGEQDRGRSRGAWYWNFDVSQELWPGGRVITEFEVDKNKGVDKFIPTYSLFNSNAGENASLYIPNLYLEQGCSRDRIFMAAGKLDLSDWFDINDVANSADEQFLSEVLVNSYTIPFPSKGIGAMVKFQPYDWLYLQSGASTANSSSTKTGLSNAFNSAFFINEFGLSPKIGNLKGNYRLIFYLLHRKLEYITDETQDKRNQFGFSLSFDQALTERITLFLRYGFDDRKINAVAYAWSAGGQITEPIPGRKYDCLGIGVAQNILGRDFRTFSDPAATVSRETMIEAYYSFFLNDYLALTSDLQLVINPDADKDVDNALVAGIRLLLFF
ncbi:MAG: carbohydrate porin [Candidatus Omnitrophica bacterium]|nr:carbohydrate porin [Candidatus Omnitrophota bacterium]